MPGLRTLLLRILILLTLALSGRLTASESPLSFHSVAISGAPGSDGASEMFHHLEPPDHFPFIIYQSLGPLLEQRFEIQAALLASDDPASFDSQTALSLHLAATYEVYWGDTLIGRNGDLAPDGSEMSPGQSYKTFALPSSIEPGSIQTLRIRGYHSHQPNTPHLLILNLRTLEETIAMERSTAMTYTLYLGFALFGIYLLAYYALNRRQYHYLFLGATSTLFGLYAVNKLLYYQLNVVYPKLDWIGHIGSSINLLLSVTAPVSVILILNFRQRWIYSLVPLPFLLSRMIDALQIVPTTFYLCATLSIAGLFLKRRHALQCVLVSALLVCTYEIPFLAYNQAIGFGILMLYFLIAVIVLLTKENRERTQQKLRNSRLQLELLKSKIQPHFILNSLTSAIEWIETNPKEGARLIQELAKEFELLSSISDKTRIPIATEIDSCRAYLKIMEYRKKAKYDLQLINVRNEDTLPPAVIRNLLENAITHNAYGQSHAVFELEQKTRDGSTQFRFSSPLASKDEPQEASVPSDGTGIQYIKARLAESYETWHFEHGRQGDAWVTEIVIPDRHRPLARVATTSASLPAPSGTAS